MRMVLIFRRRFSEWIIVLGRAVIFDWRDIRDRIIDIGDEHFTCKRIFIKEKSFCLEFFDYF